MDNWFIRIKNTYKDKDWFGAKKIKVCFLRILLRDSDCAEIKRRNEVVRFGAFIGTLGIKFENFQFVFRGDILYIFCQSLFFLLFPRAVIILFQFQRICFSHFFFLF
jgi:hypothetical protein